MKYVFLQKLPRRIVHNGMHDHGDIIIIGHPDITVRTTYNIWADDGRVHVNGWKDFLEGVDHLKIGDTMLFMLYSGNRGIFLFTSYIRHLGEE